MHGVHFMLTARPISVVANYTSSTTFAFTPRASKIFRPIAVRGSGEKYAPLRKN
jgi:hypothetical protein